MTTHHTSPHPTEDLQTGASSDTSRNAVCRLFAAALDGDHCAKTALHLLGGVDDIAHRASWALLCADQDPAQPMPPEILAGIDRALAALRDRRRSS